MPLSGIYLVAAIGLDMRAKICANRLDGSNFSAVRVRKLDDDSARPARLIGAFERYQQVVTEARVAEMLKGQSTFSRNGPYSAWLVPWMMIHQRLHPKGTLSVAIRELLSGPAQAFVKWLGKDPAAGEAYYYVRVEQQDGQLGWSSPIWVENRR